MKNNEIDFLKTLSKNYDNLPICRKINADEITPISILKKLSNVSEQYYLLESVEGSEKWGRYSFLGFDPVMRVCCKDGVLKIFENGKTKTIKTSSPLDVIRDILKCYKTPKLEGLPAFTGGFVGYFAYSMIEYAQPEISLNKGDGNDFDLMLFDKAIAYDHLKQQINIIVNIKTNDIEKNIKKANEQIDSIIKIITNKELSGTHSSPKNVEFKCKTTKEDFCKSVEKTKEYIANGDILQAVISRKFECQYSASLLNAYRVLRVENPSPYMVYMKIGDDEIISASPETLIKLKDGKLTTFPIAGSRPRGKTRQEDLRLEKELLADEKELAEHIMLVDLGKDDMQKISKASSVELVEYMKVYRYSKIMHICSQIQGDIKTGLDACNAIESILPAGTLSGAPRARACQIINELEKEPRGIYGGALGYLDFNGDMDTCIAIRMATKKDGKVTVQAGAGIVEHSVPQKEYEETENKALAVINAVCNAFEFDK